MDATFSGTSFQGLNPSKLSLNQHWFAFQDGNIITSVIACHLPYSYMQLSALFQTSALISASNSHCINLSENAILLTKDSPDRLISLEW